ncbi:MAG: metallophosphoesterase [Actinomycetota bacterium]|nr:metallophosphoesterase [Actinomycetota bacterium]
MRAFSSEHHVRAIITTGDNFYTDDVEAVWDRPFGWVEKDRIPVWPSWGNHDLETAERRRLVEEELSPPGRWYARDLGQATVMILDGNQPSDAGQLGWLENMLASRVQRPVIVVAHQPPLSCSEHGSTPVLQELWVPLLERFAAELVLSGHDHNYQRFRQSGITYVVTGGGGAGLYAMEACPRGTPPPLAADDAHHHFLVLSVTEDLIQVEARAADGQVLDRFSVDEGLP